LDRIGFGPQPGQRSFTRTQLTGVRDPFVSGDGLP